MDSKESSKWKSRSSDDIVDVSDGDDDDDDDDDGDDNNKWLNRMDVKPKIVLILFILYLTKVQEKVEKCSFNERLNFEKFT